MKKYIALLLVFVCILTLGGCNKYSTPLSGFTHLEFDNHGNIDRVEMNIDKDSQQVILSVLNNGQWINDVTDCMHDYEFTTKNAELRYHSECGTFIDITNSRSLSLSDADKAKINQIFGVEN